MGILTTEQVRALIHALCESHGQAPKEHRIECPCPYCGRHEAGHWYVPCPSDDCPSHDKEVNGI